LFVDAALVNMCMMYGFIFTYMYIYIEREREGEREICIYVYVYMFMCTYLYVCVFICTQAHAHTAKRVPISPMYAVARCLADLLNSIECGVVGQPINCSFELLLLGVTRQSVIIEHCGCDYRFELTDDGYEYAHIIRPQKHTQFIYIDV